MEDIYILFMEEFKCDIIFMFGIEFSIRKNLINMYLIYVGLIEYLV